MPKKGAIRERIIHIFAASGSMTRYALEHLFNLRDRPRAIQELSNLLSEGILVETGSGKRGVPFIIHRSPVYPFREKCTMCGQQLPLEIVQAPESIKQIKPKS